VLCTLASRSQSRPRSEHAHVTARTNDSPVGRERAAGSHGGDALFLGGQFSKLYVSSLDGTLRIFQGETFRLIQALKIEPDPNRLLYDPATDLIYFGYGGQNAGFDAYGRVGILQAKRGAPSDQFVADMIAPTHRPGHLADLAAHGDGAGDMALDRAHHRLFVGTRIAPEMTVYDSLSGKEIVSLPGPETMDGVYYDSDLKRIYMSGGRWYGTPEASPGWVYVYQQKDADHYEIISRIRTRPGSGTSLFVPQLKRLYVASQAIGDQEASILAFEPVQ
jgi:hypothetical protein